MARATTALELAWSNSPEDDPGAWSSAWNSFGRRVNRSAFQRGGLPVTPPVVIRVEVDEFVESGRLTFHLAHALLMLGSNERRLNGHIMRSESSSKSSSDRVVIANSRDGVASDAVFGRRRVHGRQRPGFRGDLLEWRDSDLPL